MVTLLAVTAALDNDTAVRLESWLEQKDLEAEAQARALAPKPIATTTDDVSTLAPTSDVNATGTAVVTAATAVPTATGATGDKEAQGIVSSSTKIDAHATTIQAQVRWCCAARPC